MKNKHKPIDVVLIMPFNAQIAIFDNFKTRKKYFKKTHNIEVIEHGGSVAVASCDLDENDKMWYSVCLPSNCNLGTVVHECSHIVDFVCDNHSVPIDIENTEIRAYMLGALFMDVCEVLGR